uniref:Polyubiquitin-B n=1 Tax=Schistocephalus solidus TaxID=70667 RepID=A0A0X3PS40_SCHSO
MKIFITTQGGQRIDLDVEPNFKTEDVKAKCAEVLRVSIPPDRWHLIFAGKEMKNGKTIFEQGVRKDMFLQLHQDEIMQIDVKTSNDKTIKLEVKPTDTIADVKVKLQEREGIAPEKQRLTFGGQQLKESVMLLDYGIGNNSTLHVIFNVDTIMNVFVKTFEGKTITLHMKPNDKVEDVKKQIQNKLGIVPALQKLTFGAKELEDGKELSEYNIGDNCTLNLVWQLPGG